MNSKLFFFAFTAFGLAAIAAFSTPSSSTVKSIYAQKLVDQVIRKNADMLDVVFHVTPTGSSKNVVIASHLAKSKAEGTGDDDLGVISSGKPMVEVQKDGKRIGVVIQLKDHQGNVIGALGLVYKYVPNENQKDVVNRSNHIRDALAKKIENIAELTSPNE